MDSPIASLFRCLTHGVYVIGVNDGTRHNAFTAAWLTQVSFNPLLIALSVNPKNSSWSALQSTGRFSVNILRMDQIDLAAHFGKPLPSGNKLDSVIWHFSRQQMPLLDQALAWMECTVCQQNPAGDHVLVVAQVVDGGVNIPNDDPLGYRETGNLDGSSALYPAAF